MDFLYVVLRLVHIVAAFAWVGVGLAQFLFIAPAEVSAGDAGWRFGKTLYNKTPFPMLFPIAAGITTLAGILMYGIGASTQHFVIFTTLGNIVLGIGAIAGLAATIHGGAVTGRATRQYAAVLAQLPDEGALSAEQRSSAQTAHDEAMSHVRVSLILMIVALIFMATARYL